MRAITAPEMIYDLCLQARADGNTIGLVPTMGALHEGHFSLIKRSLRENNLTVVSIFVNPIQFNRKEDLEAYPRTLQEDLSHLKSFNVDLAFIPEVLDLYPNPPSVSISFGKMDEVLEGAFRPGHFEGVGVVVSKLFNLVNPTRAYFGKKDLQQFLLIKKMVLDLSFQVEVIGVETVREPSGLALSSRNRRLSVEGLNIASNIYKGLRMLEKALMDRKDLKTLEADILAFYDNIEGLEVEYLALVSGQDLTPMERLTDFDELAVCFAGYVEGVRLIDNLYLRLK